MTTLKKVAEYAGVSTSTVSRVIAGKPYVKEETRQRVLKAVQELSYSPNILAKSLKVGRTNTIALMVPSIQNQMFPIVTRGVEDTARKHGYTVILCNTDENIEVEKEYIRKLQNRWIDGFIVCSMLPDSDHIRKLKADGFPVVLTSRYYGDSIDAVIIDNYRAAYEAVSYLIITGHKKIAIALGRRQLSLYQQRLEGYLDALKDHGLPIDERLIMNETNGTNSFYELTQKLLDGPVIPDAIFATSDPKAIVVVRAIKDRGFRIPEDISVLGIDNIEMSAFMEPPLTTVSQPLYEMGALAAKKLIDLIDHKNKSEEPPAPVVDVLETELIIRKSTARRK
ncbi:MAG: LacI family transcriptional regulator [Firmicutes bacterium]|nr:LacI family transcriptional regulator [Bacillota bacterium]